MGILDDLSRSKDMWGSCPNCGDPVLLRECQLFSLADDWPEAALQQIAELRARLKDQRAQLARAKQLMTEHAVMISEAVNIGKICEKIAPSLPGFPFVVRDCRCLWEPIDIVAFNGLSTSGQVESLSFLEIKTGKGRLSDSQKAIADCIRQGRVEFDIIEPKGG